MGILSFGIKAAIKAVIKKILNTERGKRIMEWLKEKLSAFLSSKITKIVTYLASLGANVAIGVVGYLKESVPGTLAIILASVGAAFALFTLLLKKKDTESDAEIEAESEGE